MELCPCGSMKPYSHCCGVYHSGEQNAATAEELMRSRYSAFVKKRADYLVETQEPSMRTPQLKESLEESMDCVKWVRLDVNGAEKGNPSDSRGHVTFTAHYIENGLMLTMTERSLFVKQNGLWYYVDGTFE